MNWRFRKVMVQERAKAAARSVRRNATPNNALVAMLGLSMALQVRNSNAYVRNSKKNTK